MVTVQGFIQVYELRLDMLEGSSRRRFLGVITAAASAGLAGCFGSDDEDDSGGGSQDEGEEEEPNGDGTESNNGTDEGDNGDETNDSQDNDGVGPEPDIETDSVIIVDDQISSGGRLEITEASADRDVDIVVENESGANVIEDEITLSLGDQFEDTFISLEPVLESSQTVTVKLVTENDEIAAVSTAAITIDAAAISFESQPKDGDSELALDVNLPSNYDDSNGSITILVFNSETTDLSQRIDDAADGSRIVEPGTSETRGINLDVDVDGVPLSGGQQITAALSDDGPIVVETTTVEDNGDY